MGNMTAKNELLVRYYLRENKKSSNFAKQK